MLFSSILWKWVCLQLFMISRLEFLLVVNESRVLLILSVVCFCVIFIFMLWCVRQSVMLVLGCLLWVFRCLLELNSIIVMLLVWCSRGRVVVMVWVDFMLLFQVIRVFLFICLNLLVLGMMSIGCGELSMMYLGRLVRKLLLVLFRLVWFIIIRLVQCVCRVSLFLVLLLMKCFLQEGMLMLLVILLKFFSVVSVWLWKLFICVVMQVVFFMVMKLEMLLMVLLIRCVCCVWVSLVVMWMCWVVWCDWLMWIRMDLQFMVVFWKFVGEDIWGGMLCRQIRLGIFMCLV